MAVEQAGQVGRKRKKIWLIRQNGERSMNQAVSSCRHSRFESECDSNAFRYRLLLLTQVLTATLGGLAGPPMQLLKSVSSPSAKTTAFPTSAEQLLAMSLHRLAMKHVALRRPPIFGAKKRKKLPVACR